MDKLSIHPLAELFPPMSQEEYADLKESISKNGLTEPVCVIAGRIIDGRHRWRACTELGIEVATREFTGESPTQYVMDMNLRRRHLNASQKACIAVSALPFFEAEAKQRMKLSPGRPNKGVANLPPLIEDNPSPVKEIGRSAKKKEGKARDAAAKVAGASPRGVQYAKKLSLDSPAMFAKCQAGEMTINQAIRTLQKEEIKASTPSAPTGKYRVIYADPPWKYNDELAISKDGIGESYGPADAHYPCMTITELCALPIMDMATPDAVLFLWTTSPLLEDTFKIIKAWGFHYKSSFVWDKIKHNMGHYNSVRHEFLLICTRGSCTPDNKKLFDSVQEIERSGHSEKPKEFREIIETLYTHGNKIELFARSKHDGWTVWGNQA